MLDHIANSPDGVEHQESISWFPDGKGFIILDTKRFASKTLPLYFENIQYKSFTRQLNIYGFERMRDVIHDFRQGAYSHPLFVRGQPDMSWQMQRQKVKGTGFTHKRLMDLPFAQGLGQHSVDNFQTKAIAGTEFRSDLL
jgi:hypothetical protein